MLFLIKRGQPERDLLKECTLYNEVSIKQKLRIGLTDRVRIRFDPLVFNSQVTVLVFLCRDKKTRLRIKKIFVSGYLLA
jgi:hypothetical protein